MKIPFIGISIVPTAEHEYQKECAEIVSSIIEQAGRGEPLFDVVRKRDWHVVIYGGNGRYISIKSFYCGPDFENEEYAEQCAQKLCDQLNQYTTSTTESHGADDTRH